MKIKIASAVLALISAFPCMGQELAPNAPKDKPIHLTAQQQAEAMDRAMAPYVAKARATWPDAKARYLAGLPPKNIFFVTVRLYDKNDHASEQVFIMVDGISDGKITGRISSELNAVKEFRQGEKYTCAEGDILDWLISKPDGSEEGNFVGKFLDTYKP